MSELKLLAIDGREVTVGAMVLVPKPVVQSFMVAEIRPDLDPQYGDGRLIVTLQVVQYAKAAANVPQRDLVIVMEAPAPAPPPPD